MQPQIRKVGSTVILHFTLEAVWCMPMKGGHSDLQNNLMYDCLRL